MYETMDAVKLIQRCQSGEAEAVRDFILQYERRVYRFAFTLLDDEEEAGEATQDVFLAALKGLDTFRGDAAISTWLYSITANICRKRIRRRQSIDRLVNVLKSIFLIKDPGWVPPEETAIQHESQDALLQAVSALEEKFRQPILLYYYHDCSVGEIAQILSIPEGTVLSRLFTARERLRVTLRSFRGGNGDQAYE